MKKVYKIVLLILTFSILLTGCYDSREVDDEVYAIAIGVDIGKNDMLRLTIQYPTYKGPGGGGDKGGGKGDEQKNKQESSNVHTIEAPSILQGVDFFGMAISRRVSLIHAKMIVFSEEFARKGIGQYIAPIQRYRETRSIMQVVISRGKAEDFILENKSNIGGTISKATELRFDQSNYTAVFPQIMFHDFYRGLVAPYGQAIAAYAGVNKNELEEAENGATNVDETKGFLPGEVPRKGVSKLDIAGLAVFHGDKMVGSLNSLEASCYLLMKGKHQTGAFTIRDKFDPTKVLVVDVRNSRKPIIKAYFKKDKPVIDVHLSLEADLESVPSRVNYEQLGKIEVLNKQLEDYLATETNKIVKKTQNEFNSDIFDFGKWIAPKFLTIQDFENYDWLKHYKDADIKVYVDVNVRRTGIMMDSSKIRGG